MIVTQEKYGEMRGVSRQYVNKLVRHGTIPPDATVPHGRGIRIDVELADAAVQSGLSTSKMKFPASEKSRYTPVATKQPVGRPAKGAAKSGGMTYDAARVRNEIAKGELNALKVKKERGELLPTDEVKKAAYNSGRIIRDRLQAVPDRISALVAAESDRFKCRLIIEKEVNQILTEMADIIRTQ